MKRWYILALLCGVATAGIISRTGHVGRPSAGGNNINWTHPLAAKLYQVILPQAAYSNYGNTANAAIAAGGLPADVLTGRQVTHRAVATPVRYAPTTRFGVGFGHNVSTCGSGCPTALTWMPGAARGQKKFTVAMMARVITLPNAGSNAFYYWESVNNTTTDNRLLIAQTNGSLSQTGNKWVAAFRTGTSASTNRIVGPGAGGTTVVADSDYFVVFTFNSDTDIYNLYLNGKLEATLSVAESSIADTDPSNTPGLVSSSTGTNAAAGTICGLYLWKDRELNAIEVAQLNSQPWDFLTNGYTFLNSFGGPAGIVNNPIILK